MLNSSIVPKTRISIVRYLNAAPLAWGILEGPQKDLFEPVLSTPSECADQLRDGKVDIGLIPSIEYQKIPGSRIVAGPAVACRHRVRSVLLISTVALSRVRTVAFDNTSRSSVILARIVFNDFYRIRPDFQPADPDIVSMLAKCDAAVLIGDAALRFKEEHELPNADKQRAMLKYGPEPLAVYDLVERWKFLTGVPFVFAFWAARAGFNDQAAAEALRASRDFGVQNIPVIAKRYSEQLSMKEDFLREYLEENVHYYTDDACLEGLRIFYNKAADLGVIKSTRQLEFL
jgi:chorismate dehydratase